MTFAVGVLIDRYAFQSSILRANKAAYFLIPTILFDVAVIMLCGAVAGSFFNGFTSIPPTIAYACIGVGVAFFGADMPLFELVKSNINPGYNNKPPSWL